MRSMRIGRRGGLLLACGLSSVLALSVLAPPGVSAQVQAAPPLGGAAQGGAATAGQPGPDGPAAGDSHLVTLVTGDVVRVSGKGKDSTAQVVTDVAPQGDVRIITQGDELFALPGVAAPLLAAGQLDVRLFNLSLLVRDGYTDDKIKQLPLIVDYKVPDGAQPPTEPVDGAQVRRRLPIAGAVAMGVDKKQGTKFWSAVTEPVKGARSGAAAPLTMAPGSRRCGWTARSRRPTMCPGWRSARTRRGRPGSTVPGCRWRCWTPGSTPATRTSRAR
ncbi:hypothetical protein ACFQYP_41920 [Nonomuraea antimicrobica]